MAESVAAAIQPGAALHALDAQELHRFDAVLGKRVAAAPGVSYELPNARLSQATRVICGYYSVQASGVEITAVEFDSATRQTRKTASVEGAASQLPQLAVQLARALGYATQAPLTRGAGALRDYAEGLETPDPAGAARQYEAAATADPGFGAAYVAWARGGVAARDRAVFERAMAQAAAHTGEMTPYYRASLAALQAEARGDSKARVAALASLQRTVPADPLILRFLGDAEMAAGDYRKSIEYYEQAARATPADADLRNLLTYAYLTLDDEAGAARQSAEYARLADGANPVDTQGDLEFRFSHFAEAAKSYLESFRRDPEMDAGGSLEKAAVSELLAGDLARADETHQRYVQQRAAHRDPTAALRQADWMFLTGRRAEAVAAARQFAQNAAGVPALQLLALTRISAWEWQAGHMAEAAQSARAALALEKPGTADLAALLETFSEALSDADFTRRVAQLYPGPANQERRLLAEGYRLLSARQWERALPVWKTLAENPNAQTARTVYAWLLLQNGRKAEAARAGATTPLWRPNQNDVFTGTWFPRLLALRAATATGADAERAARIYKAISRD